MSGSWILYNRDSSMKLLNGLIKKLIIKSNLCLICVSFLIAFLNRNFSWSQFPIKIGIVWTILGLFIDFIYHLSFISLSPILAQYVICLPSTIWNVCPIFQPKWLVKLKNPWDYWQVGQVLSSGSCIGRIISVVGFPEWRSCFREGQIISQV